ncbi:hypothetical protein PflCFBP13510_26675 [Pseudomonas fluorescens]|nr:hypothetical protein PflCFBP13510_26675 [Pseudomonas fluorescens]
MPRDPNVWAVPVPSSQANATLKVTKIKCGSWLACESGSAVDAQPAGCTLHSNHDAKRAALDLLVILISGAPLNHAGRTQA